MYIYIYPYIYISLYLSIYIYIHTYIYIIPYINPVQPSERFTSIKCAWIRLRWAILSHVFFTAGGHGLCPGETAGALVLLQKHAKTIPLVNNIRNLESLTIVTGQSSNYPWSIFHSDRLLNSGVDNLRGSASSWEALVWPSPAQSGSPALRCWRRGFSKLRG